MRSSLGVIFRNSGKLSRIQLLNIFIYMAYTADKHVGPESRIDSATGKIKSTVKATSQWWNSAWKKTKCHMTIFYESFKHAYSHVTKPRIPCLTASGLLVAKRARTWRGMFAPRVLTLLGRTAAPPGGQHAAILAQWRGCHLCLESRLPFCPKHA